MKTWYVKELSRLTNVSIRTLHYYDKIGLLKPSSRLPNGYRVYLDKDLRKLEQIIALKFFGFTLSRIQELLVNEGKLLSQLEQQLVLLQSEVSFFRETQKNLLIDTINSFKKNPLINWHDIVLLINNYTQPKNTPDTQKDSLTKQSNKIKKNVEEDTPPYENFWKKIKKLEENDMP